MNLQDHVHGAKVVGVIVLSMFSLSLGIPATAGATSTVPNSGQHLEASALTSKALPLSASGLNQEVWIYVDGSGCDVTTWWTSTLVQNKLIETWASYWVNGKDVETSLPIIIEPGGFGVSVWTDGTGGEGGSFKNGTKLCVTWYGIPGKPCETIEC
jgi:hypothetical protein